MMIAQCMTSALHLLLLILSRWSVPKISGAAHSSSPLLQQSIASEGAELHLSSYKKGEGWHRIPRGGVSLGESIVVSNYFSVFFGLVKG